MSRQDIKLSLHLKSKPDNDEECEILVDCKGRISEESLTELFTCSLEAFRVLFNKSTLGDFGFTSTLIKMALEEISKTAPTDESQKQ